jgi:hypothetical protein
MFGSLFRRQNREAAPALAPVLARMAAPQPVPQRPPHPILARMLAESAAIGTVNRFVREDMDRVRAPLADAPRDALAIVVCDALVRLPAAPFEGFIFTGQPETRALLLALQDVAATSLEFSAAQMTAICWAVGELFDREWRNSLDWPTSASELLCATLAAERCPRSPEVTHALRALLDRIGSAAPIQPHRVKVVAAVVAWLGLPRNASPILGTVDADFARREAVRERIAAIAGADFAPLVDALIDVRLNGRWRTSGDFAKLPEVAGFLGQQPAVLGAALAALFRITRDFPKPDYNHWGWLARRDNDFTLVPPHSTITEHTFGELAAMLLRRRIDIADAAMAELLRHGVPSVGAPNPWRSRHFLNHALKVATGADGSETRAALLWLASRGPPPTELAIPDGWKHPIAQALSDAALGATLTLPELDLTIPGSLYMPRWNTEVGKLLQHFQALLDPRLHDAAHRRFLADLTLRVAAQLARMELDPAMFAAARERFLAVREAAFLPGDAEQCLAELAPRIAHLNLDPRMVAEARARFLAPYDTGRLLHADLNRVRDLRDEHCRARVLQALLDYRDRIVTWLDAVAPFVTAHPAVATSLAGLCQDIANKSVPAAKWLTAGAAALAAVPHAERMALLSRIITLVRTEAASPPDTEHVARGLIWLAHGWDAAEVAPTLADLALGYGFQSVPGQGIRDEKLGNACLWALIHLPDGAGVPYLARLLTRVKYPKVRTRIDAALNEAAAKAGVARGVLDEMTVPDHGLDAAGEQAFAVGGGRAVVALAGNRGTETRWFSPEGNKLKAANAAMKADKDAMRAVKAAAAEIEADLATQVIRLQRLYLGDRSWTVADWRRHYATHPLMARLTRRLLWWFERDGTRVAVLPQGDQLVDMAGRTVAAEGGTIRLWHPIEAAPEDVLRWRDRIEALALVQPFAQVWREIYRLTDAEQATATYSNRWAGHILKQHQAMTLARLNGWTVTHRMWVDVRNDEPWHLLLPHHRLVADYWVEGAGNRDDPERLDSNAFAYVATDRLMFHRIAEGATLKDSAQGPTRGEPVALTELPPLVLSEVMRHCDLFTAVASIASDPLWRDRGAAAGHPNDWRRAATQYWERQSLGPLTEAAKTRHALLARIVPRLAIADRCSLNEDGLTVRGTRHTYRIHLGSAAIFIEDQRRHLCIVPAAGSQREPQYYVPFDGDRTTSVIISKAMMLAHDDRITDPTILSQL